MPAEVLDSSSEWLYNENRSSSDEYDPSEESNYMNSTIKMNIIFFIKSVQRDCKFDLGFMAKMDHLNSITPNLRNVESDFIQANQN